MVIVECMPQYYQLVNEWMVMHHRHDMYDFMVKMLSYNISSTLGSNIRNRLRRTIAPIVELWGEGCVMCKLKHIVVLSLHSEKLHPIVFVEFLGPAPRDYNTSPIVETWFWPLLIKISRVRLHLPQVLSTELSMSGWFFLVSCWYCVVVESWVETRRGKRPTGG